MAGAFTAVDLSQLPFPDAVEQIDFEVILAEMLVDFQARMTATGMPFTALVESDPAYKILEVAAYRETLIRQRANEEVKAVTLAYATGADLDNLAANYNVERLVIQEADDTTIPPTPEVLESDADLRRRVQLSFEGFSTAGPRGAYVFHALGADADILDINVDSPTPGVVEVAVLSRTGSGEAPAELLDAVDAVLSAEDIRPLTDQVTVKSAIIVEYAVEAVLTLYPGPDGTVVLQTAQDALDAYIDKTHRIGLDVTLSGLYRALHQEGVQNVTLIAPSSNLVVDWDEAPFCTGTDVTIGGTDE